MLCYVFKGSIGIKILPCLPCLFEVGVRILFLLNSLRLALFGLLSGASRGILSLPEPTDYRIVDWWVDTAPHYYLLGLFVFLPFK